jgi:hypothetical protein
MWLIINRCLAFITASTAVLGEKLGGGLTDHPAGLGFMSGALFLRSSRVRPTLLMTSQKVVTYVDCSQEAYAGCTWTSVGSVHVVCIGFFPAGCTSIQITATLRYE